VEAICAFARQARKPVTIVFDGPAPVQGWDRTELGSVRVLYAGGGRTAMSADDRILGLLEKAGRPADLTVVTSDRRLANRARSRGATILPGHKFRHTLRQCAAASAAGPEKPTHIDLADWTAYFNREDPDTQ
jgi:predicted RNA-binding protein with PIN domain